MSNFNLPPSQQPRAVVLQDVPEVGIPESPSLFSNCQDLWLCYGTTDTPQGNCFAVIYFGGVIDFHLQPINDQGLGKHAYAQAGLTFYSFHEIENSPDADRWSAIGAKHWVITFKDETLDVIAISMQVIRERLERKNPHEVLLNVLEEEAGKSKWL